MSTQVSIHNKINPNFREVHVDGAHGGITSKGYINLNFYAERQALPKTIELSVDDNGQILSTEISADSKIGFLREYEFGIYMDLSTATEIVDFLQSKIKELTAIKN